MESQELTDRAQEARPTYFVSPATAAAYRQHFGCALPSGYAVLPKLPRMATDVKAVRIRTRREYSAMPHWLAFCILAATRQHNPFPSAPMRHTWASAGALLMSMQTLERMTRLPLFNPTQGATS